MRWVDGAELATAEASAVLAAAQEVVDVDALRAVSTLRAAGWSAELSAAALTQVRLRQRAAGKFGADAAAMFFTTAGLEQATRSSVASRRAARVAAAGVRHIADLGCGIGADTLAFARAGLRVLAVEFDPATAELARANVAALGFAGQVEVHCADATTVDLGDCDAVFCDPARRDGDRRRFDPAAFSPPWSFVAKLVERVPHTVLKLAPGLDHALIPAGAEAEWVSVDGGLVEAALWCGPLAATPRRATVLRANRIDELTGTGTVEAPVGGLGSFVYAPDGAVLRAHLVAEFAESVGGHLADPHIAYVFADTDRPTPFARCFAVEAELPFALKRLRAELRHRGIGRLEILKRGVSVEPDQLRRDLKLDGPHAASLILFRRGDTPTALLGRLVG